MQTVGGPTLVPRAQKPATVTDHCQTSLLSDQPAGEDAFGSHERIARAVAELVRQEPGGRTIGLTGSYGSGKSTVVRLLGTLCGESGHAPSSAVFVFDAWAHQGDPLRRAFLETLTAFLLERGWIPKDPWTEKLDILARRTEKSETTSEPVLTLAGRLVAGSALFLPLAYSLFGKAGDPVSFLGIRLWIYGLVLALAPVLVAIGAWLLLRPADGIVGLLIQKTRETKRSTTVRSPDPTSLEFQELFLGLVESALSGQDRRLVLVMDNIDRLEPADTTAVWGTMRTFLESDTRKANPFLSHLWLLVPFDPVGIRRLLGSMENDAAEERAAAFIEKTFQTTFRVPPLVLSDWRKFLSGQLAAAFPAVRHREEFDTIYRLYRLKGVPAERIPNPRAIKLFVNGVGALHRQWGDEIPLVMQALYTLYAEGLKKSPEDLTKENFLEPAVLALVAEPDWRRYLAALHFNAAPDKALEVLIKRQVEDALVRGDSEPLKKLLVVPGFVTVCDQILQEQHAEWAAKEPSSLTTAALALSGIESGDSPELLEIWKWLRTGVRAVEKRPIAGESVGKGLVQILERIPTTERRSAIERVLVSLSKALPTIEPKAEGGQAAAARPWVEATLPVIDSVKDIESGSLLKDRFRVPGTAGDYVEVFIGLQSKNVSKATAVYYLPDCDPASIVAELARRCSEGTLDSRQANAIDLMTVVAGGWRWDGFVAALAARLQGSVNLTSREIIGCVRALLFTAFRTKVVEAQEVLKQLATQGHLMHQLYQASTEKQAQAIAACMLPFLEVAPTGDQQTAIGNSAAGQAIYKQTIASPSEHGPVVESLSQLVVSTQRIESLIGTHGSSAPAAQFIAATLEMIAKREDSHRSITPTIVRNHYREVSAALTPSTLEALVARLVREGSLLQELMKQEFSADLAGLYRQAAVSGEAVDRVGFSGFLLAGLRDVSEPAWRETLASEGPLVELVLWMLGQNVGLGLAESFADALREHSKEVLAGQRTPSRLSEEWSRLPLALQADLRETFWRDIRDEILLTSNNSLSAMLALFGESLIDSDVFDEKADDVIRQLGREIVDRADPSEVSWLDHLLKSRGAILQRAPNSSKATLRQRVETVLRRIEGSDPARPSMEALGRTVGVELEKIGPGTDSSGDSVERSGQSDD